jgi:CRP/FNR family transcriptional regulator, cyclic AMP receptor protein
LHLLNPSQNQKKKWSSQQNHSFLNFKKLKSLEERKKLSENNHIEIMEQFPFFEIFSKEEKETIASCSSNIIKYQNGNKLITQGDEDHSIFIILSGNAIVTQNQAPNSAINTLRSGAVIGEMAFLAQKPRTSNVIAQGEVICLKLDGDLLRTLEPHISSKFKDRFIQVLIRRVEKKDEFILKLKKELELIYENEKRKAAISQAQEQKKTQEDFDDNQSEIRSLIGEINDILKDA